MTRSQINMDFSKHSNRCDIVLLSWNNTHLIKKCVESIFENTRLPCHLIIVDNNSKPETRDYLKTLESTDTVKVTLDFNDKNEGFSKGMNRGLRKVTAPYACILNNDTEVTRGWLNRSIEILEKNPHIGVMNPQSNIFGVPYTKDVAEKIETQNTFKEMGMCIGFCMFIRKDVIEKIGYLDAESYPGYFFEDSDYSKRVKKAGYICALAQNAYVYHQEHQSVNKLSTKEELFKQNQKNFYAKWGKPKRILVALHTPVTWETHFENLLPLAKDDHFITVLTDAPPPSQNNLHTQIGIQKISSPFFKPFVIFRLLTKLKKPYDYLFIPQPDLQQFFEKTHLLYRRPLIKTYSELNTILHNENSN